MLFATLFALQGTPTLPARVDAWRAAHEPAILAEFRQLLQLPNVAGRADDIPRNAAWLEAAFRRRGFTARRLTHGDVMPAVYAERRTTVADAPTVVLYAHYDGQPAGTGWTTPPWTPTLRAAPKGNALGAPLPWPGRGAPLPPDDARVYARSASDDKGPIQALLAAIDALDALRIPPSVHLKVFLEGGEEAGSYGLDRLIAAHRESLAGAALWLFVDGPMLPDGRQQLLLGVRGVVDANLTVFGPAGDLHSGHYGNLAPNPNARLAHLVAAMRGEDGGILVPGAGAEAAADDPARTLMRAEAPDLKALMTAIGVAESEGRATQPDAMLRTALNVSGWAGGGVQDGARNVVPASATAFLDFRLVPGQTPEGVRAATEAFLRGRGWHLVRGEPTREERLAHPRLARIAWTEGYAAARTSPTHPVVGAVSRVVTRATGSAPALVPTVGGSLPISRIVGTLDAPFVILPIVNADNRQHAPDENLRLGNLRRGITLFATLLADLGPELR